MLRISELYIYPVKSLAGIAVTAAEMTSRGLKFDRRLMLVDQKNVCLTQRDIPEMALLQPSFEEKGFSVRHKHHSTDYLFIPHQPEGNETAEVRIWKDVCRARIYDESINQWFSNLFGIQCKLVYMPDTTNREVERKYALNKEITSFADAYPALIIGQASLDDLNERLEMPIPMNRFRPNIVFTGGEAFLEDRLEEFRIGEVTFSAVKPCERCVMITINQETTEKSKEPTKSLAGYRKKDNNILFGQNLLHEGNGIISVGDNLEIKKLKPAIAFSLSDSTSLH
jgi:uncharacterized protein YcbX